MSRTGKHLLLELAESDTGLLAEDMLIEPTEKGHSQLILTNPSGDSCTLQAGTLLGEAEEAECIHPEAECAHPEPAIPRLLARMTYTPIHAFEESTPIAGGRNCSGRKSRSQRDWKGSRKRDSRKFTQPNLKFENLAPYYFKVGLYPITLNGTWQNLPCAIQRWGIVKL